MKYNLFCINTEYHFLLSLSIVHENFTGKGFKNIFVLLESGSGRLKNIVDNNTYDFLEIIRLKDTQPNLKETISNIVGRNYDYLFHFYEFNVITAYIRKKLNKSCTVVYGEDGTAIYQKYSTLALGSRTKQTINDYKKAYRLGILSRGIKFQDLVHGRSSYIDELWLTHPELYLSLYKTKKKVKKITLLPTKEAQDFAANFFAPADSAIELNGCIFFLGRVSYSPAYLEEEIKTISKIQQHYSGMKFYLKAHPLSKDAQLNAYRNLGINLITENRPAEMILAQLDDAIIMGVDSTALFFENKKCVTYALYKYLQEKGVYPAYREIPFPAHVQFFTDATLAG